MYFPTGLPKIATTIPQEDEDEFHYISCNRERILLLIVRKYTLAIWQLRPLLQLSAYRRSESSIRHLGHNVSALWKPDSSSIVLQTAEGGLIFFRVESEIADNGCYVLDDIKNSRRVSDELYIGESVPYIFIAPVASLLIAGGITGLESLRDNVMVSSANGLVQRIQWDGTVNEALTLSLEKIPFSVDFPQSKKTYLDRSAIHVIDLDYSYLLGGFSLVLSNGRGALMTATHFEFLPETVQCVWVPHESTDFTCTAVNHKFRLMAFGCQNAQGALYCIEDQTEGIQLTHKLLLSDKDCPDMKGACGPVVDLNWTPDGCALAVIWQKGGYAIWSAFGALISFCLSIAHEGIPRSVSALEWGTEGYSLWLMDPKIIFTYSFVKSALAMNNCSTNRLYVLLQGEHCLMLNTGDKVKPPPPGAIASSGESVHRLFSNKSWIVVQYAFRYVSTNWPLRFAVVDAEAESIAIAGRHGLAYYTISNRKWKTFGNDTAEQLFVVTGGLLWWKDFLVCGCFNVKSSAEEVRFYPKSKPLDHGHATIWKSTTAVMSLNVFRDMLIVFTADSSLALCGLEKRDGDPPSVLVKPLQLLSLEFISPHPHCVVSVDLTPLKTDSGQRRQTGVREAESLLINVSGRLWIIQREPEGKPDGSTGGGNTITPHLLSSCVEILWVHPGLTHSKEKPHLSEALWMFCGAHGMKVWMPLFPKENNKKNAFLSRRMMIPVRLKILPLCVLFDEAMVHGAESDCDFDFMPHGGGALSLPSFSIQRTSEVYLPQVMRELLRKNLGAHALEIAQTCRTLPYFNHSLELLLHQVLEEEGTSSEPTPDPLLPSVVAFVQEFPVFLQTIAHCARKSDIALWPRLFGEAGEPVELFRECLNLNQLNIAASFLIVLNSALPLVSVKKEANLLLDKAKAANDTELVGETIRFLRALESEEVESQRKTPDHTSSLNTSKSPTGLQHSVSISEGDYTSPVSPQGTSTFKYGPPTRSRTISEKEPTKAPLKRASTAPFANQDMLRSVAILSAQPPSAPDSGISLTNTVDRVDSLNHTTYSSPAIPVSTSSPSLTSKTKWSRRRFPGHAQPLNIHP